MAGDQPESCLEGLQEESGGASLGVLLTWGRWAGGDSMRDSESGEQWLGCPEPRVAPVLTKGMLATRGVVQTDLLIGGAPLPQKLVSVLCSEPVACPLQCALGGPLPTPLLPRLPRGRAVGPVWARVSCADRLIRAVPKGACVGGVCGRPGGHTSRRGPQSEPGLGESGPYEDRA